MLKKLLLLAGALIVVGGIAAGRAVLPLPGSGVGDSRV